MDIDSQYNTTKIKPMKLADIMSCPLKELVEQCNITKIQPISNDDGVIQNIIVEYVPHTEVCDV